MVTAGDKARCDLAGRGFAWLPRSAWRLDPCQESHWESLRADWDRLEPDAYLEGGATFRRRRFGRFRWLPAGRDLLPLPHRAYYQPEEQNPYAGGVAREFAPLLPAAADNPFLHELVGEMFACLPLTAEQQAATWEVRVHQIRILATAEEVGLPTPEGIHQDGTDFLTLHLVRRDNVAGGESTIYDLERNPVERLTLEAPLDSLILDDPRLLHAVTPVRPADGRSPAVRDILGLDFILNPDLLRPGRDP